MARLAIEGGSPQRATFLPYGRHSVDDADVEAVVAALRSGWLTTGPRVAEFEEAFAEAVGAGFAVAMSSGTAALHAAAEAADIGPGDEAVVPPLTFAGTANCVRYQGGSVVFADVRPDTMNIDPARVEAAISPNTKALLPVDYAGQPCDIDELNDIARRRGLSVIHDACHSLGATYRGRPVGALATMTVFSLHPVKAITAGEGGVVTTDDAVLAARLRSFRNHGITADSAARRRNATWVYEIDRLGFNYRITDVQCALAHSQLSKLKTFLERRSEIAGAYMRSLGGVDALELPTLLPDRDHAWHIFVVRLRLDRLRVDRRAIFEALHAENIGVNVHYIPVPWHPYYRDLGYRKGCWPAAEDAYERALTLPIFPDMTDTDVEDVVAALGKVLSAYRA